MKTSEACPGAEVEAHKDMEMRGETGGLEATAELWTFPGPYFEDIVLIVLAIVTR